MPNKKQQDLLTWLTNEKGRQLDSRKPNCGHCNDVGRRALVIEIVEGLRVRGHWIPKDTMGPDLISAIFMAIDNPKEKTSE